MSLFPASRLRQSPAPPQVITVTRVPAQYAYHTLRSPLSYLAGSPYSIPSFYFNSFLFQTHPLLFPPSISTSATFDYWKCVHPPEHLPASLVAPLASSLATRPIGSPSHPSHLPLQRNGRLPLRFSPSMYLAQTLDQSASSGLGLTRILFGMIL